VKSKGVGDTIEKITEATGIKKVVDMLPSDCGCKKRKEYLNRVFPYKNK